MGESDADGREELLSLYAEEAEATRLTRSAHGRLELLRTQELIRRLAPAPPARVIDVGGATGIHASWLAQDGYRVHVVDLVPGHVEAASRLDGVTAEVGDARALSAPDASVDITLLLGPLYHLPNRADRVAALAECRRVLRPGGVLFAAAISRYLTLLQLGTSGQLDASYEASVASVIASGVYDAHAGFMAGHWHTADELAGEVSDAGFRDVIVFGIEGPAWPTLDAIGVDAFDEHAQAALQTARLVERDPLLIHASAHLLATASA